jgi:hypothetical protein
MNPELIKQRDQVLFNLEKHSQEIKELSERLENRMNKFRYHINNGDFDFLWNN